MAMAASPILKHLPFFLFLVLILSSVQIEARVNKFFSKFIHTDHNVVLPVAPSPAPLSSLAPTPAPAPFFDESQNAYGLYGRDSDDGESSRTITDVEEEILAEDGEESQSHKSAYPKTNLHTDNYESPRTYERYHSNYESNGYRNSEYKNNEYRNSEYESDFENNGDRNYQYQSNFEDDGFRRSRYEATERQGMSDTRFMENGRYYHDINSKNGEEGEMYGSNKNPPIEFDSMEEYEKSEGILP